MDRNTESAGINLALGTATYATLYHLLGHRLDADLFHPTFETYNFFGIIGALALSVALIRTGRKR